MLTYQNGIIISSHVWTTGPPDDLAEYASHKAREVLYIGHPLFPGEISKTFVKTFVKKDLKEQHIMRPKLPSIIPYFFDFLLSIIVVLSKRKKYDVFFGIDPLNALAGLVLKKLGIVRFVVLYTIDYVPQRFKSRVLNRLYHLIDFHCVNNCNATWNLSERMSQQRRREYGDRIIVERQFTVPLGIHFNRIRKNAMNFRNQGKLIYVGRLEKLFGVELVVESFARLTKEFPNLELTIVGNGELEHQLREMVKTFSLEKNVKFRGVIQSHIELERLISEHTIGFAVYAPIQNSYKQYTDVGKPKLYMACGLPVVITRTPPIAKEIERTGAGIIVDYNPESVVRAVKTLLLDNILYEQYRESAILFAKQFDWELIFDEAFSKLNKIFMNKETFSELHQ